MNDKKIIVALDSNNLYDSKYLVDEIKDQVFAFKIGYEFFLNFGLFGYNQIKNKKVNIFLDLKLHDIPNTTKNGIEAIADLNPYFTTIHITGGDEMQKIANLNKKNVKILGVSILTSIDSTQAEKYYSEKNINNLVGKFVKNALENKLDGVVCSPLEIELVKKISSGKLIIVTPGIRPENYNKNDDQKRFMSPKEAVNLGANYLVIGRPITQSSNPLLEITSINSSIE
jgi:orotidine-5'-phosphate decarboxylase